MNTVDIMKMIFMVALVLVLLAGMSYARSCFWDDDCYSDEYCSNGTCKTSGGSCCGPALILGALVVGAFVSSKGKVF